MMSNHDGIFFFNFDTRNDPWAIADRMAWGELELPLYFEQTTKALTKLSEARKNINLPNQKTNCSNDITLHLEIIDKIIHDV